MARGRRYKPGALRQRLSQSLISGGGPIMLDRYFSRNRSRGQGLVEYALIIALVAVVVIGTLILLGPQIASIFKNISNNL
jgi:pilus assembly protein Flp/PilA